MDRHDLSFLAMLGAQDNFANCDELEDIKFDLISANVGDGQTNAPAVNTLFQNMKISAKINIDRLAGDEEDISEWFDTVERLATAEGWNKTTLGTRIPSYLTDTALLIWKNMKINRTNYDEIKRVIIKELEVDRSYLSEFCTRTKKDTETVVEFSHKLQLLCDKAGLDPSIRDKTLLKQFWECMDAKIKRLVLSQTPANSRRL